MYLCSKIKSTVDSWGACVAQLVKRLTLDFSSGHDLRVVRLSPISLARSTSAPHPLHFLLSLSLSLSQERKEKQVPHAIQDFGWVQSTCHTHGRLIRATNNYSNRSTGFSAYIDPILLLAVLKLTKQSGPIMELEKAQPYSSKKFCPEAFCTPPFLFK